MAKRPGIEAQKVRVRRARFVARITQWIDEHRCAAELVTQGIGDSRVELGFNENRAEV